jgi:hypothetical protein
MAHRVLIAAVVVMLVTAPTAPTAPDGPSAETLRAARAGDVDAQLAAAAAWLRERNHAQARRWCLVAAMAGSAEGQKLLARHYPAAFRRSARRDGPRIAVGDMVRISGWVTALERRSRRRWTIDARLRVPRRASPVVTHGLTSAKRLRVGHYVTAWGRKNDDGSIAVLLWHAPPPTYVYRYRLRPEGAAGGQSQTFTVDVTVRNTGPQPIRELQLTVRFRQEQSSNDRRTVARLGPIGPGATAVASTSVRWHNQLTTGRTSIPKVTVRERKVTW